MRAAAAAESTMTLTYSTKNIYTRRQLSFAELACAMMNRITVSQCDTPQWHEDCCSWLLPIRHRQKWQQFREGTRLSPKWKCIKLTQPSISYFTCAHYICFIRRVLAVPHRFIASIAFSHCVPARQSPRTQSPPSSRSLAPFHSLLSTFYPSQTFSP